MGAYQEKDYCVDEDEVYNIGESWTNKGMCNLKVCQENAIVAEQECDPMPPPGREPQGCKVVEGDLSLKFPDCCTKLVCPNLEDTPPEIIEAMEEERVWDKFYTKRLDEMFEEVEPLEGRYHDPDWYKPEWQIYDPDTDSCACPGVEPQEGCRRILGDPKKWFPACCDKLTCSEIVDGSQPIGKDDV